MQYWTSHSEVTDTNHGNLSGDYCVMTWKRGLMDHNLAPYHKEHNLFHYKQEHNKQRLTPSLLFEKVCP